MCECVNEISEVAIKDFRASVRTTSIYLLKRRQMAVLQNVRLCVYIYVRISHVFFVYILAWAQLIL